MTRRTSGPGRPSTTPSAADPQEAWELVAALLLQAPDEHLGAVAAGALEDVVTRYGVELMDVIERAAQRDARVRRALAGVWISWGTLPHPVIERLVRASGGAIKPLGERQGRRRSRPDT